MKAERQTPAQDGATKAAEATIPIEVDRQIDALQNANRIVVLATRDLQIDIAQFPPEWQADYKLLYRNRVPARIDFGCRLGWDIKDECERQREQRRSSSEWPYYRGVIEALDSSITEHEPRTCAGNISYAVTVDAIRVLAETIKRGRLQEAGLLTSGAEDREENAGMRAGLEWILAYRESCEKSAGSRTRKSS